MDPHRGIRLGGVDYYSSPFYNKVAKYDQITGRPVNSLYTRSYNVGTTTVNGVRSKVLPDLTKSILNDFYVGSMCCAALGLQKYNSILQNPVTGVLPYRLFPVEAKVIYPYFNDYYGERFGTHMGRRVHYNVANEAPNAGTDIPLNNFTFTSIHDRKRSPSFHNIIERSYSENEKFYSPLTANKQGWKDFFSATSGG